MWAQTRSEATGYMLSIHECREILSGSGPADLCDDEVASLRDVLTVIARLYVRQRFGIGEAPHPASRQSQRAQAESPSDHKSTLSPTPRPPKHCPQRSAARVGVTPGAQATAGTQLSLPL